MAATTDSLLKFLWSVFEIPLDKELASNWLFETGTKLRELILATMALMWVN